MASVVVNGDTSGAVTLTAPAVAGTVTVTLPSTSGTMAVTGGSPSFADITATGNLTVNGNTTLGDASTDTVLMTGAPSIGGAGLGMGMGFRNRIINGAMVIDQRNAGASVSNANGYTLDRWYFMRGAFSSSPVFNVQQSTTVPSNYKNSLSVTVGTSGAPGANNYSALYQLIEGLNVADFGWGSATASTVTLSFWVNCSVAGTYGVSFQNSATNRSYIASYTINAANTWEQKTVTVAGDQSGTWLTTNGIGVGVYWDMGVGTGQSTTAGSWQAGNYLGLTGGTKLSNTGSATFYITGVQLEKGSTATSFDYRPYGTELALCQRYCMVYANNSSNDLIPGLGTGYSSTHTLQMVSLPVPLRASAITVSFTGSWSVGDGIVAISVTNIASGGTGSINCAPLDFTVASGITTYRPYYVYAASSTAKIIISVEL